MTTSSPAEPQTDIAGGGGSIRGNTVSPAAQRFDQSHRRAKTGHVVCEAHATLSPTARPRLESQRTQYAETLGSEAVVSNTRILWKFVMRVEPEGESPFEAKVDELLPQMSSPSSGARFPVLYDPDDHSKVVVDHSDEGYRILDEEMRKERVDAMTGKMRARGQDVIADRYRAIHDPALGLFGSENLSNDPDERKKQLDERRAKIKEVMSGQTAEDRLALIRESQARSKDAVKEFNDMVGGQNVLIGGQPVQLRGAAGAAATADALTKLADLRDRGVLTDEEFQAQKKKLLGE